MTAHTEAAPSTRPQGMPCSDCMAFTPFKLRDQSMQARRLLVLCAELHLLWVA